MADFTWSYSSLKQYQNCPKQYYEIKVAQNFEVIPSEKMIYGTEVHKALEDYVKDGKELALNYIRFKGAVDELIAIPGEKYAEYEMALGKDKSPCAFADPNRWVRGIVDLLIVDNDYAFIVDHFPQVNKIKAGLLFVMHNSFITEEYERKDIDKSWDKFKGPLERLNNSYESNSWPPNYTPLCRYCPVKTCDFNQG
jgi:CRISPR/Cas system-associated exonuclease Cas4 (RecB family)